MEKYQGKASLWTTVYESMTTQCKKESYTVKTRDSEMNTINTETTVHKLKCLL